MQTIGPLDRSTCVSARPAFTFGALLLFALPLAWSCRSTPSAPIDAGTPKLEQASVPVPPMLAVPPVLAVPPTLADPPIQTEASPSDRNYTESIRGTDVAFDMVWIPEGNFWIGRCEVTWDEFLAYCDFEATGKIPPGADVVSKPSVPLDWTPYDRDWGVGRRPAVGMSWNSARKYCQWLSSNTGKSYRLPTEKEWLSACDEAETASLGEHAWFAGNSDHKTQEVGLKLPNSHGLYDMLGNLWEYSQDPFGPSEPERAVLRGGSWRDEASALTATARLKFDNSWTLDDPNYPPGVWWIPEGEHLGLRILRKPDEGLGTDGE